MNFNMNGSFGGTSGNSPTPQHRHTNRVTSIQAEQIFDIVCSGIIFLSTLLTLIFWDRFSETLFYSILLPVIKVGGTVAIIAVIILIAGAIHAFTIDMRRHRWFF